MTIMSLFLDDRQENGGIGVYFAMLTLKGYGVVCIWQKKIHKDFESL